MELIGQHDEQRSRWQATCNGSMLLEYVYAEPEDPNPSFRTVNTLGGERMSLYRPWDHPWHTGFFFSWKYINGLNFWESRYHGQPNKAVTDAFKPLEKGGPGFRQSLSYITHEGNTLLHERRTVVVEAPEQGQGYWLLAKLEFTPAGPEEVELNRTEITEASPWGGYAGFTCRLVRSLLNPVIKTDRGERKAEEAYGHPFKWCDYSGKLDGNTEPRWAGVCLMDHPDNPRHPTPMLTYDYKDMQLLNASLLAHGPCRLRGGETLTLRYACYVHDGEASQQKLDGLWQRFAEWETGMEG